MFANLAEFHDWYRDRCQEQEYWVEKAPLDSLTGWKFDPDSGNLVHGTGRFFTVEGLDVCLPGRAVDAWQQPIIVQPESGVLGILVAEFGGIPHCLLQVKMEPGNVNGFQLSPTVQATRSNFTRVHGGRAVPYLEHFTAPRTGQVLSDVLQSEQASWFLAKRNRNMILRVEDGSGIEVLRNFCWLSFEQLDELFAEPNLVNMDTRTVLAGAVGFRRASEMPERDSFRSAMARSREPEGFALHSTVELLSWFTEAKGRCGLARRRIALSKVQGWTYADGRIVHDQGKHFSVIGVDVRADGREVAAWQQPMFEPRSRGVVAFLVRRICGVLHLLVQARTETGGLDSVEMAPTVQCQPDNYYHIGTANFSADVPLFLHEVLAASDSWVRFDNLHSEEGGRFYHAENRYLLVEVDDDFPLQVPENYAWMTLRQLTGFVRYGHHLNVEARSLLATFGFYQERCQ